MDKIFSTELNESVIDKLNITMSVSKIRFFKLMNFRVLNLY